MPCPVGYKGNQLLGGPFCATQFSVHNLAQQPDDVNIFPLVKSTDIIGLSHLAVVENLINRRSVVLHIQLVLYILTFSIYRQWLIVFGVVDRKGEQLFSELVGHIIIGAVTDYRVHLISIGIRSY